MGKKIIIDFQKNPFDLWDAAACRRTKLGRQALSATSVQQEEKLAPLQVSTYTYTGLFDEGEQGWVRASYERWLVEKSAEKAAPRYSRKESKTASARERCIALRAPAASSARQDSMQQKVELDKISEDSIISKFIGTGIQAPSRFAHAFWFSPDYQYIGLSVPTNLVSIYEDFLEARIKQYCQPRFKGFILTRIGPKLQLDIADISSEHGVLLLAADKVFETKERATFAKSFVAVLNALSEVAYPGSASFERQMANLRSSASFQKKIPLSPSGDVVATDAKYDSHPNTLGANLNPPFFLR
jgi:hypothetical protein